MKKLFLIIISLLFFACSSNNDLTGKVIKVADGDTITILHKGKKTKVRFYGIDAPEKKQEYGMKSLDTLKKLVNNKNVKVEIKDKDQYGRVVGIVYLKNTNVNLYMLETGSAWWYKRYAKHEFQFEKAVKKAQKEKIGLWKKKNPMAPWEFRKKNRRK